MYSSSFNQAGIHACGIRREVQGPGGTAASNVGRSFGDCIFNGLDPVVWLKVLIMEPEGLDQIIRKA